jgi:hypothetical protein
MKVFMFRKFKLIKLLVYILAYIMLIGCIFSNKISSSKADYLSSYYQREMENGFLELRYMQGWAAGRTTHRQIKFYSSDNPTIAILLIKQYWVMDRDMALEYSRANNTYQIQSIEEAMTGLSDIYIEKFNRISKDSEVTKIWNININNSNLIVLHIMEGNPEEVHAVTINGKTSLDKETINQVLSIVADRTK